MKLEPIKPDFNLPELDNFTDKMSEITQELANKTNKKREDLIIEALEFHGYIFQNKDQLYEFAKRCEVRQFEYDPDSTNPFYMPLRELWYENECICIWDEKIDSKMEGNTMVTTQRFAINPKK